MYLSVASQESLTFMLQDIHFSTANVVKAADKEQGFILPVEPPPSSIGLRTGAAFWCLIIVTVKGGKKVVIVRRKAIGRVTIVVEYT